MMSSQSLSSNEEDINEGFKNLLSDEFICFGIATEANSVATMRREVKEAKDEYLDYARKYSKKPQAVAAVEPVIQTVHHYHRSTDLTWLWVLLSVVPVLLIIIGVFLCLRSRSNTPAVTVISAPAPGGYRAY